MRIPLSAPDITEADIEAVVDVLRTPRLSLGPKLEEFDAAVAGYTGVPYAVALLSMFLIYLGMSWRSGVPPYYFLLHPVSTVLFVYTLLRSMVHTLWNDGIVWRGTRYPLEELRKGMV